MVQDCTSHTEGKGKVSWKRGEYGRVGGESCEKGSRRRKGKVALEVWWDRMLEPRFSNFSFRKSHTQIQGKLQQLDFFLQASITDFIHALHSAALSASFATSLLLSLRICTDVDISLSKRIFKTKKHLSLCIVMHEWMSQYRVIKREPNKEWSQRYYYYYYNTISILYR